MTVLLLLPHYSFLHFSLSFRSALGSAPAVWVLCGHPLRGESIPTVTNFKSLISQKKAALKNLDSSIYDDAAPCVFFSQLVSTFRSEAALLNPNSPASSTSRKPHVGARFALKLRQSSAESAEVDAHASSEALQSDSGRSGRMGGVRALKRRL
eukprot:scaffold6226_cov228-Pinguiococcus_pyrenoidosus.AAC.5